MTRQENEAQLERQMKKLDFSDWLRLRQGIGYVPVGNPDDGEVELERGQSIEEEV